LKTDYINYLIIFDLKPAYTILELEQSYQKIKKSYPDKEIIELGYKILKDPFYSKLYFEERSLDFIIAAGFFFDRETIKFNYSNNYPLFLSTPINKLDLSLLEEKSKDDKYIVLLNTGAYSPLHYGHINMMEQSKIFLEKQGYKVLGGYFSPSHDDYLNYKLKKDAKLNASKRVHLMEDILEKSWIMIDKWESYYNFSSINFTDVIIHLEKYLSLILHKKIEICYVYGDDNEQFSYIFKNSKYMSICVERLQTHKTYFPIFNKKYLNKNKNIFYIQNNLFNQVSSTEIRNGNIEGISKKHNKKYLSLISDENISKKFYFFLREDIIGNWEINASFLIRKFKLILEDMFNKNLILKIVKLKDQHIYIQDKLLNHKSISLDSMTKGTINLNVSRLFDFSSSQIYKTSMKEDTNIYKIKKGRYILIEDDIDTGATINWFYKNKPQNVEIIEEIILNKIYKNKSNDFDDVLDYRDFIIGSHNGGAMAKFKGNTFRLPYILPFLSPVSRLKIPFSKEIEFSIKIWNLNIDFFKSFDETIYLKDLQEKNVINLFLFCGFSLNDSMVDICNFHIDKLRII
jgi:nicotinic acid mononucleotide adenylyltransferase